jgi:phospholipid-translocating P-type ATPase (flippase)
LLAAVLTLIPQASPVSPFGQILPLAAVLLVTAIKDGIEDYRRYRADRKANMTPYTILRKAQELRVKSRQIHPGDIVYIAKGEQFPADMVLLSSSEVEGTCFIDTCELDGETNLKRRRAVDQTAAWMSREKICSMNGSVECDLPNEHLYRFHGRLFFKEEATSKQAKSNPIVITNDQLLLRGATLRNTSWIYGMVVYAGKDTKIYRNLRRSRLKVSSQDRKLNYLVLAIFGFNLLVYGLSLLLSGLWQNRYRTIAWYIDWDLSGGGVVLWQMMTYFVLYTYMIPISLFVTIEICRIVQAWFMTWDKEMRSEDGIPMTVKNSNLNEDLGAVSHVFTDKTGTLTQNIMTLTAWSIEGMVFDRATDSGSLMRIMQDPSADSQFKETVRHFCRAVALCNTVIPSVDEEHGGRLICFQLSTCLSGALYIDLPFFLGIIYEAQSPDEAAILNGLRDEHVWLVSRSFSHITLDFLGIEEEYMVLDVLEFTSERKCMSIIVQDSDGRKFIYSKGADQVMFEQLNRRLGPDVQQQLQQQLFEFSRSGLRTLVVSYAEIDEEQYGIFKEYYENARCLLNDQDNHVLQSYRLIENEMRLLGATAVEDQLQDKVPETITFLLQCDIHVWMLTGDKQETAINIGYSSRLVTEEMEVLVVNITSAISLELVLDEILKRIQEEKSKRAYALVVDGVSLTYALREEHSAKFLRLCEQCHSVICCRVGPLQKSLVVKLVRKKLKRICLAIGDGANDVSMIETANIGVGIAGKEGAQASRASDYSFVQFKSLKRLLAVHGRYSYLRMSTLLMYSFYKNMAFILVQFWFGLYSAWSAQVGEIWVSIKVPDFVIVRLGGGDRNKMRIQQRDESMNHFVIIDPKSFAIFLSIRLSIPTLSWLSSM